jgi:hypothetical protein
MRRGEGDDSKSAAVCVPLAQRVVKRCANAEVFESAGVCWGVGGIWHKASSLGCMPLTAPIGLSPLRILTLCGSKRVLVVSMSHWMT